MIAHCVCKKGNCSCTGDKDAIFFSSDAKKTLKNNKTVDFNELACSQYPTEYTILPICPDFDVFEPVSNEFFTDFGPSSSVQDYYVESVEPSKIAKIETENKNIGKNADFEFLSEKNTLENHLTKFLDNSSNFHEDQNIYHESNNICAKKPTDIRFKIGYAQNYTEVNGLDLDFNDNNDYNSETFIISKDDISSHKLFPCYPHQNDNLFSDNYNLDIKKENNCVTDANYHKIKKPIKRYVDDNSRNKSNFLPEKKCFVDFSVKIKNQEFAKEKTQSGGSIHINNNDNLATISSNHLNLKYIESAGIDGHVNFKSTAGNGENLKHLDLEENCRRNYDWDTNNSDLQKDISKNLYNDSSPMSDQVFLQKSFFDVKTPPYTNKKYFSTEDLPIYNNAKSSLSIGIGTSIFKDKTSKFISARNRVMKEKNQIFKHTNSISTQLEGLNFDKTERHGLLFNINNVENPNLVSETLYPEMIHTNKIQQRNDTFASILEIETNHLTLQNENFNGGILDSSDINVLMATNDDEDHPLSKLTSSKNTKMEENEYGAVSFSFENKNKNIFDSSERKGNSLCDKKILDKHSRIDIFAQESYQCLKKSRPCIRTNSFSLDLYDSKDVSGSINSKQNTLNFSMHSMFPSTEKRCSSVDFNLQSLNKRSCSYNLFFGRRIKKETYDLGDMKIKNTSYESKIVEPKFFTDKNTKNHSTFQYQSSRQKSISSYCEKNASFSNLLSFCKDSMVKSSFKNKSRPNDVLKNDSLNIRDLETCLSNQEKFSLIDVSYHRNKKNTKLNEKIYNDIENILLRDFVSSQSCVFKTEINKFNEKNESLGQNNVIFCNSRKHNVASRNIQIYNDMISKTNTSSEISDQLHKRVTLEGPGLGEWECKGCTKGGCFFQYSLTHYKNISNMLTDKQIEKLKTINQITGAHETGNILLGKHHPISIETGSKYASKNKNKFIFTRKRHPGSTLDENISTSNQDAKVIDLVEFFEKYHEYQDD